MRKLYFITGNQGKFTEAKRKLSNLDITLIQKNLGYPEIQAETLEEVASYGVVDIKKRFQGSFILEDAGLFINTFNGFPGVYSKYVHSTIGCKGILDLMKDVSDRKALFKSVYAYSEPNKKPKYFFGECSGIICSIEQGKGGFGYDPIFIPNNETHTFAEMNVDDKNRYSHRGQALNKLINFLKEK